MSTCPEKYYTILHDYQGGTMKNDRLFKRICILFLIVFLMSCAKGPLIAQQEEAIPAMKAVTKPIQPPKAAPLPIKPPEARQPEVKSPVVLTPSSPVNRNTIGCIFPLAGRFGDTGGKALDAVLLSAEIFNQRFPSPWRIIVADSGDSAEKIKQAVAYLADQKKVMAIVAISGTAEANDAAREAQKRQVPLIMIASKEGVTEVGEYVFQHFLTPTQQIEALTKYARDTLNVGIFSVLYPQDDYGEEMVRHLRSEVQKTGGKVDKAIPYNKTQTDFTEQIKKLTGNKIGASETVYATREDAQNSLSLDFEALFIPDSALRVKMITSQLAFYDVKRLKLLGPSLWHSPDLIKKGVEYLEGASFVDSFLVDGFLPQTNDFVDIYYSAYGREPGNIEALSYDTMEMVLSILEDQQIKTRAEFIRALLALEGFRGATGSISFGGNRVAQKDAFILRVQNGKIEQVK
jgi:branched-chain amino acid transport system substrate-binding protein